ncbi:MAG: PEP-CTERM sorting domain-containing protein [Armatimonadetes bacterium]|nr:PEP-CTERM sorting domain-containing protein [Armatimonadota bacterium]
MCVAANANGILTINDPHKTVTAGSSQSILFTGTLSITQDWNSLSLWYPHAYLQGGYGSRIDAGNVHSDFLTWLGTIGSHQAGATYSGGLFYMDMDAGDPMGMYDHTFASLTAPCNVYIDFNSNQSNYVRSNVTAISINAVPEPGTYAALGLGLVGVIASRRKRSK